MTRIELQPRMVAEHAFPRVVLAALVAAGLLVNASATHAAGTPEQACQKGRYSAAAKYSACQQKAMGNFASTGDVSDFEKLLATLSKCRVKYTSTWARLQAKASGSGSTCDNPRFNDNGDGTVTDRLTALQWEKKTDDDTVHDKDNVYQWSTGVDTNGNGTAFAYFLLNINENSFAGTNDWRLPTLAELQTILLEPYPCTTTPCIDPVFGPTVAHFYGRPRPTPRFRATRGARTSLKAS